MAEDATGDPAQGQRRVRLRGGGRAGSLHAALRPLAPAGLPPDGTLGPQARQLAGHGRNRIERLGDAVSGSEDRRRGNAGRRSRRLAGPAQRGRLHSGLALQDRRCPHQTQAALPVNSAKLGR